MDDLKRFLATGSCCAEALVRLGLQLRGEKKRAVRERERRALQRTLEPHDLRRAERRGDAARHV